VRPAPEERPSEQIFVADGDELDAALKADRRDEDLNPASKGTHR